jgi:hypothetical protein
MKAKSYSVRVRVRRTLYEYADVSVPLEDYIVNGHVDGEAVMKAAVSLAESPNTPWASDGVPIIELHPIQGG